MKEIIDIRKLWTGPLKIEQYIKNNMYIFLFDL